MNLQTVITNLRRTIAGKEMMLKEYNKAVNISVDPLDVGERMAITATVEFLEINIDELKRILQDVEVCAEQNIHLHQQLNAASWLINPDRSGGQFTQDEIDNASAWR